MSLKADLGSALIIESQALAQSHLKYSLLALGFSQIDVADRGYLATRAINNKFYDLILCASDIGNGPDGYQLFEQLVVRELLPNATCFVFLSSEQELASSQSALELQPDDFILKPYSAKEIEHRLTKSLTRKIYLRPVLKAIDKRNYAAAFEQLNRLISDSPSKQQLQYLFKLKGDLLLKLERWSAAKTYFAKLNENKSSPWSKLGYAQSLLELGELDQAYDALFALAQSNQTALKANDLLAKLMFQLENFEQANEHYRLAVEQSPRNLVRLKDFMDLSRLVKDLDSQHQASTSLIRQLKGSIHETPEQYLSAIRANIDYGFNLLSEEELSRLTQFNQSALVKLRKTFPGVPLSEQVEIAQARLFNLRKQPEKAKELLSQSLDKIAHGRNYIADIEDAIDQAKALHELGFFKESETVFEQIRARSHDKPLSPLVTKYIAQEQSLRQAIKESPQQLNNKAVGYFQRGNVGQAMESFSLAFQLMPKNPSIALNLMQSAIDSQQFSLAPEKMQSMVTKCRETLEACSLNDDQQQRYDKLNQMLDAKLA